jgi:hypothetical protein
VDKVPPVAGYLPEIPMASRINMWYPRWWKPKRNMHESWQRNVGSEGHITVTQEERLQTDRRNVGNNARRLYSLDYARGVAVLLVATGHFFDLCHTHGCNCDDCTTPGDDGLADT